MPATKTKSPALAPRLHVPSALMAPGGLSVLTPFGEGACAKLTLDAMAIAAMQAKTNRGNIWALHAEKATCIDVRCWGECVAKLDCSWRSGSAVNFGRALVQLSR